MHKDRKLRLVNQGGTRTTILPPCIPPLSTRRNFRPLCMFFVLSADESFVRLKFGFRTADLRRKPNDRAECHQHGDVEAQTMPTSA